MMVREREKVEPCPPVVGGDKDGALLPVGATGVKMKIPLPGSAGKEVLLHCIQAELRLDGTRTVVLPGIGQDDGVLLLLVWREGHLDGPVFDDQRNLVLDVCFTL